MSTKMMLVAGFAMSAVTGTAVAADAAFDNHLTSTPMVSPAQLYQTDALKTDFALGFLSATDEVKPTTGDKTTSDVTGTRLFAAGIYNIQAIGLRAGLVADYVTFDAETKTGALNAKAEGSVVSLSPTFAYVAGPVALGLAIDVNSETTKIKVDGAEEIKQDWMTVRPGVLFANEQMEAGVTYTTKGTKDAVKKDGIEVAPESDTPAEVTLHGRYAVDKTMAFGAIVGNRMQADVSDDTVKDLTSLTATAEFALDAVKLEGDVGYNMATYKKKEELDSGTIGTVDLGAAADYTINKQASVGGGVGYEFGADENTTNKNEYAVNTLSVLVRGDMKF